MGNVLVNENTLVQIAEAIREKNGTEDLYKPAEMPEAISGIQTSGPSEEDPVRFYGLDGELLYSYSLEEMMELTELPAIPEAEGLIVQGWNWTLESIQNLGREVIVGAIYTPDDGSTRIYVNLIEGQLSPILGFAQDTSGAVFVDWGDGSELETTEEFGYDNPVNMKHEYAKPGEYVIRLIPQNDTVKIYFLGDSKGSYLLRKRTVSSEDCFVYLNAVTKLEIGKRVYIKSNGVKYLGIEQVVIPEDIVSMAEGFLNCYNLEYVAFPRSITSLPSYTAERCYKMKVASVPDTLTVATTYAFAYDYGLKTVTFPDGLKNTWSHTLSNCYNLKRVALPKSLTSVGASLFVNCYSLEEVVLQEGLIYIEGSAFNGCANLKKLDIPEGVIQIGTSVFNGCNALRELKLPESLETISASGVRSCYGLTELTIPANVVSIGAMAFAYNYGIAHYYLLPETPPTLGSDNVFYGILDTCKIHVPKGCLEAYQTAEYWSTYADYMVEMEEEDEETEEV